MNDDLSPAERESRASRSFSEYFEFRNVSEGDYDQYEVPQYLLDVLPNKNSKLLDFGCGFGQMLKGLRALGYMDVDGADINAESARAVRESGVRVFDLSTDGDFFSRLSGSYDFIIASHVIEHIPKSEIVEQLAKLKMLLRPEGGLILMVPNAQSNTGSYWAYEDFTHTTLFTSGSLFYVLRAAGFSSVDFLDIDCTAGMSGVKAFAKRILLGLYRSNRHFWNRITGSAYHGPSPEIFSYEIKAIAR